MDIELSDEPGSMTELGRIMLLPANQIVAGVVVDADDKPIAGVPIFIHGDREVAQLSKSTVTDEQGRFRFHRVCQGNVRLQAGFRSDPQGYGSTRIEAGCKDVRIVLQPGDSAGRQVRRSVGSVVGPEPRYMSLKGKNLSQIEGLEKWIPEDARDKPFLLLFFDKNQRPSRETMLKLATHRSMLSRNNVVVVLLHTNGIDQSDLNMWLAQQKIPFKAQVLDGGFSEKYKYIWGVRSLPWLILTDGKQIVRAEGFSMNEIDEKLQRNYGD
jgi:hypothetical protein